MPTLSALLSFLPTVLAPAIDPVRNALEAAEEKWFRYLLFSSLVVALGCILEIGGTAHSLIRWWRMRKGRSVKEENPTSWRVPAEAVGLLLVIVGVIGEAIYETLASEAETSLRAHDENILADALHRAGDAKASASGASIAAMKAEDAAGQAQHVSDKAALSAGNASARADAARQEANSFESRIATANANAANAEEHLAEALRQAAQAQKELERIRSPRSLSKAPELLAQLKAFTGTEYTLNVFQDAEATQFAKAVGDTLSAAGWVRKQPETLQLGVPSFNVFSQDPKDSVPLCIETGVQVHVRSKFDLQTLQALSLEKMPRAIQAATAFRVALASQVFPSDDRNVGNTVIVEPPLGEGPVVICIGKKP